MKRSATMAPRFNSSRPDAWVQPRPTQDPSQRFRAHGKVLPMEEPGFLSRLFGRAGR